MKTSSFFTLSVLILWASIASAQQPDGEKLAGQVLEIFKVHCAECHGRAAEKPQLFSTVDDLAALRISDYVNLSNPQASDLLSIIVSGDMPKRTKADKEAGKKRADPLSEEQVATVRSWLMAGAPAGKASSTIVQVGLNAEVVAKVETKTEPKEQPKKEPIAAPKADRKLVTIPEEVTAALTDLQTVPREDQPDVRYVSLAFAHNNTKLSEARVENLRRGLRKLLNSLSTAPRIAKFPEVGPDKVLFRVLLRDLGWDAALWEHVAAHSPVAVDTGVSSALGSACHTTTPILRADWLAANAARPPLYHDIMRLPKNQHELERQLGIDLLKNIAAGEVVRSGLMKSGISLANRLVERHEIRNRSGYYWASYDFGNSGSRSNLLKFPLGPESARLLGGQLAFKHDGGEFVFTLPNGLHGYYVSDALGNRLDGAAPTNIVGDRLNITGRVEISNGLSCIVCHDNGIKPIDAPDAVRAVASGFGAEEQKLIERLYPAQNKFDDILKADTEAFHVALKSAGGETVPGQSEPVGALAGIYDGDVSLEVAAAEIGLAPADLQRKLDEVNAFFALKASFKDGGNLLREHFLDFFPELIRRLDVGTVRGARPIAAVPQPGRTERPRPIPVELRTDKSVYREGEDLVITVQAAEAGHLRLLYQNAKGEVYTLFPNEHINDDRIEGGRPVKIVPVPNRQRLGEEVAIVISGPNFGTEYLAAIVTDQPFTDEAALRKELRGTTFAKSTARDIERAVTKDARVVSRPAREGAPGGARAGFARVTLTTVKR
jgi:mono/diheme cytochrome c family protein